jgi:3-hydroxyisobutyrate dehydrogenase-like beta-hydroxyacid dehydrogenase
MENQINSICLLGFGEVGSTLAKALVDRSLALCCFDINFSDNNSIASRNAAEITAVQIKMDVESAIRGADLIISAVTAEQAINAARSVVGYLKPKAWYLDVNSVAPNTKRVMAEIVDGVGGQFVEAVIMSPIYPLGIKSPILLGGPHGQAFLPLALSLGLSACQFFSVELGKTAASKMCRSVMIKGLESLLTESLIAARYYGVEEQVLNSLGNLMPGLDWQQHSAYMISRSVEHGIRRAEEMREVTKTVRDAGLTGAMSAACAQTQDWTAQFKHRVDEKNLLAMLDQFREHL